MRAKETPHNKILGSRARQVALLELVRPCGLATLVPGVRGGGGNLLMGPMAQRLDKRWYRSAQSDIGL